MKTLRKKLCEDVKKELFEQMSNQMFKMVINEIGSEVIEMYSANYDGNKSQVIVNMCDTVPEFIRYVTSLGKGSDSLHLYYIDEKGEASHKDVQNADCIVHSDMVLDSIECTLSAYTIADKITTVVYIKTDECKIKEDTSAEKVKKDMDYDACRALSKVDIDKLNKRIELELRKTAEAIQETTDAYELLKATATTKEDLSDAVDTCSASEVALKHNTGASTKSKKDLQPLNFYVLRDYLLRKADDIECNGYFDRAELELSINTMCYDIVHKLDKLDSVLGFKFDFIADMYNSYADLKQTQLDIAELYNIDDNDIVFLGLLGLTHTSPDIDISIFPEVHMYIDKENKIVNIYVVDKNRKKNVPLKARIARDIMDLILKIDASVVTDNSNSISKNIDNIAEQIENKMNVIGFTEYTTTHKRIPDQYMISVQNYINYIDPDNHNFAAYIKPDHKKNVMNIYIVY